MNRVPVVVTDRVAVARSPAGFGVVEAMIVLSACAISALWVVPSVGEWGLHARVDAGARAWIEALEHARLEVLRTGAPLSLCAAAVRERAASDAMVSGIAARDLGARVCADADSVRMCAVPDVSQGASWLPQFGHTWDCARLVSNAGNPRASYVLREWTFEHAIAMSGDPTPLRFVPPLGRIAGRPRHFEMGPRSGGRERDVRAYRCVLVAASGRIRMREGPCEMR